MRASYATRGSRNLASVCSSIQHTCLPLFVLSLLFQKENTPFLLSLSHAYFLFLDIGEKQSRNTNPKTLQPTTNSPSTEPKFSLLHQILTPTLNVHKFLLGLDFREQQRKQSNPVTSNQITFSSGTNPELENFFLL